MASDPRTGPPEEFQALYDHVVTCGKCGFCQPTCPIFRATGREGHVARGKLALYQNIIEGRTEIGPDARDAFSNCLLCRACTENCFSSVRTDQVVISFRHAYAQRFGRGLLQRWVFRHLLPRPGLMRFLVRSVWALRKTGLADAARRIGLVGLLNPKLERALELRAGTPGPLLRTRLARRKTRDSAGRPRVGYWMSCGYNYVLPDVGEATVRVLERLGMNVEVLDNCCCGLAAYGYGDREAAAELARENLRRLGDLERFDAIVSECGSCSGHLKEYPEVLAGDPEWGARAARLKEKTRSFSEFVVERGGLGPLLAAGPAAERGPPRRQWSPITIPAIWAVAIRTWSTNPGNCCSRCQVLLSARRPSPMPAAEPRGPTAYFTRLLRQPSSGVRWGSWRTPGPRSSRPSARRA